MRKAFTKWAVCKTVPPNPTGYGVYRKEKKSNRIHLKESGIEESAAIKIAKELNGEE